jgi:3-hydroxyacyl-CoA dehydrogenase / enoyl-CoA hydratase / 3-hydroxybutyryl-CoA epimerase
MSNTAWVYAQESDGIGLLTLDVPGQSANTLSSTVLQQLDAVLQTIEGAPPRGLVIRSGKKSGFIAGADINEFATLTSEQEALVLIQRGQRLCDRIAALQCPTVALLHGFALGGGMELALACKYRVGVDDGKLSLGLPEVQLGIHPGFGGTVRAVRLIGVRPAMDMMLTGKTIRSDKALRMGLVDALVPASESDARCRRMLTDRPPAHQPGFVERALSWPLVRGFVTPALLRQVRSRVQKTHYPAPYAIVDLWSRYGARGRTAFDAEAKSIAGLFQHATTGNLVRVFQLQDRLKALGGKGPEGGAAVRHVHVVGAGIMGGDIAAWCALRGFTVTLQDRTEEQVKPALVRAEALFAKRLPATSEQLEARQRLTADVQGAGVAQADVIIEAIFENRDAKRSLYAALIPNMKATAILATNTSSLVLESLIEGVMPPDRFVGLHFFNPVAQMPLIEVIHAAGTSPATLAIANAFVRRIDKLPLPCRSVPGFLVNRVLIPYMQEGMTAVEQGIAPEVVDKAATDFGMPMGPVELSDVVGLDVCKHVGEIIGTALGRTAPIPLTRLEGLLAAKQLGRKSGQGYYRWVDGKAQKSSAELPAAPKDLTDRLMLLFANESVACWREAVVEDADLVDAGLIFGAGYAPFRGGPLRWARQTGPSELKSRLERLAIEHGSRFTPDAGWSRL